MASLLAGVGQLSQLAKLWLNPSLCVAGLLCTCVLFWLF